MACQRVALMLRHIVTAIYHLETKARTSSISDALSQRAALTVLDAVQFLTVCMPHPVLRLTAGMLQCMGYDARVALNIYQNHAGGTKVSTIPLIIGLPKNATPALHKQSERRVPFTSQACKLQHAPILDCTSLPAALAALCILLAVFCGMCQLLSWQTLLIWRWLRVTRHISPSAAAAPRLQAADACG